MGERMAESACICPRTDGYRIKRRGCSAHAEKDAGYWREQDGPQPDAHPMVTAVRDYLDNAGITPETLRYAATHEALCRSWIYDLLTGLADTLDSSTRPGQPTPDPGPHQPPTSGGAR